MTPARLAANRRNAQKSAGARQGAVADERSAKRRAFACSAESHSSLVANAALCLGSNGVGEKWIV